MTRIEETPEQIAERLVGKTIVGVKWASYLMWPLCVEEITFDDGSVLEMEGNADYARVESLTLLDRTKITPAEPPADQ